MEESAREACTVRARPDVRNSVYRKQRDHENRWRRNTIHPTPQDLPLAAAGGLCKIWYRVDYLWLYRSIINQTIESSTTTEQDFFSCFAPQRCSPRPTSSSFLVKKKNLKKKVNGHGQLSLRLDRDEILLLRISRRSSQVSPPIYLRHKFKPRSRNDSSSRRQRWSTHFL